MDQFKDIDNVLDQINDIRTFLKNTDELLPFLKELFQFIKDIIPLISDAKLSLLESTTTITTASTRIVDVNKATEMATHEILDKLDSISTKLASLLDNDLPTQKAKVDGIQNEIMDIIYALQFQDITSQKLQHAGKILDAIYERFVALFDFYDQIKKKSALNKQLLSEIKNPKFQKSQIDQAEFQSKIEDKVRHEGISQDDIDQLFK
jgi:chemotaxis regulatin CheY-phosphate phosphatase CheZ